MARFGSIALRGDGEDLVIITYVNGVHLSVQAAEKLRASGVATRVIDLRWLAPLPVEKMLAAVSACQHVLIVDECRRTGNVSEEIMTALIEAGRDAPRIARVTANDSFIATGPAYAATLPSVAGICAQAAQLVGRSAGAGFTAGGKV